MLSKSCDSLILLACAFPDGRGIRGTAIPQKPLARDTGPVATDNGKMFEGAPASESASDRDQALADRFKRLPPAIPVATTVAIVGGLPTVPVGPDGAGSGGDGD